MLTRRFLTVAAPRQRVAALVLALATVPLWTTRASAQAPAGADLNLASRHFSSAEEALSRRHYRRAATSYQAAHDITKDSLLLINIGDAWYNAGEATKAADAYRAYLGAQPAGADRPKAEARLRELAEAKTPLQSQSAPGDDAPPPETVRTEGVTTNTMTEPETAVPTPPAGPAQPTASPADTAAAQPEPQAPPGPGLLDDKPPTRMRVAAWSCLAATVATLTAGAIFGLAAQSRSDEISRRFVFVDTNGQPRRFDATAQKDYNDLKSEGELYNYLGIGFFSAAAALAVTTTTLFVVDYKRSSAQPRAFNLSPAVANGYAGASAAWSF